LISILAIADDGVISKLSKEEYLLDVIAEFVRKKLHYELIFQRTVWIYPITHMDNEIYVDMMFHQCIFDYIDGLMLVRPGGEPTPQIVVNLLLFFFFKYMYNFPCVMYFYFLIQLLFINILLVFYFLHNQFAQVV
jgi:hypothetical protein